MKTKSFICTIFIWSTLALVSYSQSVLIPERFGVVDECMAN